MKRRTALLAQVPGIPSYNPVKQALELAKDRPEVSAALKLFASMPASTGVFANPVRHNTQLPCRGATVDVAIREFTLRGVLHEHDIASGAVDGIRTIFTGMFARLPGREDDRQIRKLLDSSFATALGNPLSDTAQFMKRFPHAIPNVAMQHAAALRKAGSKDAGGTGVSSKRAADHLLVEMIGTHMSNVAVAAASSYMRHVLEESPRALVTTLCGRTRKLSEQVGTGGAFARLFSLLLRRPVRPHEFQILDRLGAIQVHHGSAGSNMVARYLSSLHTRSVSDLFTAAQMTLDCARHFGAITDLTDFIHQLERTPERQRDEAIRSRILSGNLPTFGHPEISAAGRGNSLELDPRPALYLAALFEAIDAGQIPVGPIVARRASMLARMYQIAFVEGVEKGTGRLRVTPNTDFGAWLVLEALGIEEQDRTLLSYAYRGFGWMMDVREQLQQPIIRPVIPPDPALTAATPQGTSQSGVGDIVSAVHARLMNGNILGG